MPAHQEPGSSRLLGKPLSLGMGVGAGRGGNVVPGMGEGRVDGVVGVERIYSLLLIIFPEDLANAEPSIIVGALYGGSACDEC